MYPSQDVLEKISIILGKEVSRETITGFEKYITLLLEENKKYNLIGKNEAPLIWERHIIDSLQLYPFLNSYRSIVDLGSGAGFPGVPLSIVGIPNITLVDSHAKKCLFLEKVSRETNLSIDIVCTRVEDFKNRHFEIGISRAMASLVQIMKWAYPVCSEFLIMKGKSHVFEIEEAQKIFTFEYDLFPSMTNREAKIIKIKNLIKR